ncbi:helix-turn-helix domain-containing protein [Altericroceibacterium spongiae]|uniref:Helix-turn-helix domain-containing protein n=1 Tax=Altericroceibacterium spongiae TaxID=2320269 RepID=A0A420EKB7_9SPHN|nr:helix-turn-helix domain-containing protein [Altericroceibacterium spongiae]RKF21044.1 helix-turn-helix domain-containing protein [Altericroceibacterium spongiae]
MVDENPEAEPELQLANVGERLRTEREKQGLTLQDVAKESRIPLRHLQTMEADKFADLPGRTYAFGFTRSYAKLLGLDQDEFVEQVHSELDAQEPDKPTRPANFEPGDPARVPSARLGWLAVVVVIALLIAGFVFLKPIYAPSGELPSLTEQEQAQQAAEQRATASAERPATQTRDGSAAQGPVVFTAMEDQVWVKFYDGDGQQLMQKIMSKGESYTVPADAEDPQIWTGRPDALSITIGGKNVPRLADDDMVIRDMKISAAALLARDNADNSASPSQ